VINRQNSYAPRSRQWLGHLEAQIREQINKDKNLPAFKSLLIKAVNYLLIKAVNKLNIMISCSHSYGYEEYSLMECNAM
jgi:hypothetical protein